ncbi:hypothetical protein EVAR_86823_1 [Eumeta japonica]|uniref:Uncharacterized protein n=1 Tax=Eumeta variegata TaxID=151549 RepID=A0A4C1VT26_EUMVA|nr:hypothetical protein EVAR_86823_1 [Eumeta japonica]
MRTFGAPRPFSRAFLFLAVATLSWLTAKVTHGGGVSCVQEIPPHVKWRRFDAILSPRSIRPRSVFFFVQYRLGAGLPVVQVIHELLEVNRFDGINHSLFIYFCSEVSRKVGHLVRARALNPTASPTVNREDSTKFIHEINCDLLANAIPLVPDTSRRNKTTAARGPHPSLHGMRPTGTRNSTLEAAASASISSSSTLSTVTTLRANRRACLRSDDILQAIRMAVSDNLFLRGRQLFRSLRAHSAHSKRLGRRRYDVKVTSLTDGARADPPTLTSFDVDPNRLQSTIGLQSSDRPDPRRASTLRQSVSCSTVM